MTAISLVLLGLIMADASRLAHGSTAYHKMITLYAEGPRPQTLTGKVGIPVVWLSHLVDATRVVVTVAFLDGHRVAQVTSPVTGYNGFTLDITFAIFRPYEVPNQ